MLIRISACPVISIFSSDSALREFFMRGKRTVMKKKKKEQNNGQDCRLAAKNFPARCGQAELLNLSDCCHEYNFFFFLLQINEFRTCALKVSLDRAQRTYRK